MRLRPRLAPARLLILLATAMVIAGCGAPTRQEILETARQYVDHQWQADDRNRFHGVDRRGVRVDTPDQSFYADGWQTGGTLNRGMAYQWGGFCTPGEFDEGIEEGRPAGHVARNIDWSKGPGHSREPVGVDCSGFVSRCWDLDNKYSTKTLPLLCTRLKSFDELLPGDIINRPGRHCMLVKEFADANRKRLTVYEAHHGKGRCVESTYPVDRLRKSGYVPLRYRRLSDK